MRRLLALALGASACSGGAWQPAPVGAIPAAPPPRARASAAQGADAALYQRLDPIVDELLAHEPSLGREAGLRQAHDGRVAAVARADIEARVARLRAMEGELTSLDAAAASADAALDRGVVLAHVRLALFRLAEMEEWRRNPRFYEELFAVNDYLDRDYAPLAERARRLLAHERAALAALPEVRRNLQGPLARAFVEVGIKVFEGYESYLAADVPRLVRGALPADEERALLATNAELAKGAKALAEHLRQELPRSDRSHVLGKERFLRLVAAQEGAAVDLDAFRRRGEEDLARNKAAMTAALRDAKARPTRPKAAELLGLASRLSDDARAFLVERRLVTIPSDERCTTKETPPYMRWNSAFLSAPGPFDAPGLSAFYYITLPDPKWPKREQEEYVMPRGTLLSTTVHEVYPGHFLQGLWRRRAPTRVQKIFATYSYVEGWAHYVEEMMLEEGFGAADPQSRTGQLSDALLRNCRWVGAIAVHVDERPLDAVAKRFATDCFQDKATAREQANRATFDPGYFAYTYGKIALLDLRAEVKRRLGERYDARAFHDALLAHGSPPLPLLRERVLRDLTGAP